MFGRLVKRISHQLMVNVYTLLEVFGLPRSRKHEPEDARERLG